jgi:mannose-6-phosphate isomerase-like protein (cupin superfamily)
MRTMLGRMPSLLILFGLMLIPLVAGIQPQEGREVRTVSSAANRKAPRAGYVLAAREGEVIKRKGNSVTVKVDPRTGSPGMAMGTQALDPGAGIPVHMHEQEDEVLFIHGGRGVAVLGEQKKDVGQGDTVFIPHGVWHGVESRGEAIDLLWIVTPPGLEGFFRETGVAPGAPPKVLTPAQLDDIGRKHGVRFKR